MQPVAVQPEATTESDSIAEAVAASTRPDSDKERDAARKPAETMRFIGIAPGMTVVDLMAGGGYYSELFAGAVGPSGKVYVQNNSWALEKFADKAITERLGRMNLDHVTRADMELDSLTLPADSIDVAFMGLFYHDSVWMKVDRDKMNKGILAALKPGGIYAVTDHRAQAGAKLRDVKNLHRIEAEIVKSEIIAAGFEFVGETDMLSHPEDPRTGNVFDEGLRGKTDRFVFKFRKPTL